MKPGFSAFDGRYQVYRLIKLTWLFGAIQSVTDKNYEAIKSRINYKIKYLLICITAVKLKFIVVYYLYPSRVQNLVQI